MQHVPKTEAGTLTKYKHESKAYGTLTKHKAFTGELVSMFAEHDTLVEHRLSAIVNCHECTSLCELTQRTPCYTCPRRWMNQAT